MINLAWILKMSKDALNGGQKQALIFKKAFPYSVATDVDFVLANIDLKAEWGPHKSFSVFIGSEVLKIPERIYLHEKNLSLDKKFNDQQKEILFCLYSRHHNGFIREQCAKNILASRNIWTAPYIIRLVGEYIVETLDLINANLNQINATNYQEFIKTNPKFYKHNKGRVASYWDCHYRNIKKENYSGFKVIKYFDRLLATS